MSFIQIYKVLWKKPMYFLEVGGKAWWKMILYFLFLGFILSLPIVKQVNQLIHSTYQDFNQIEEKLPNFTIENNQLTVPNNESGFIYQTPHFIFTFDPEGKRNIQSLESDLIGNTLAVAMLQNQFVLILPDTFNFSAFIQSNIFSVPYKDFKNESFTKNSFIQSVEQTRRYYPIMILVAFIIAMYTSLIALLLYVLVIVLMLKIFNRFKHISFPTSNLFKIIIFCSTIPCVLVAIINVINPHLNIFWSIIPFTAFIYFYALQDFMNRMKL